MTIKRMYARAAFVSMLAIAAGLVMTTASCSSENDLVETPNVEQPQVTTNGVQITVGAGFDDASTRSAVVIDGTKRVLTFTDDDKLYVYGDIDENKVIAVSAGISENPFTYAPVNATGHALSASVLGEIVGTDGLAYAVAAKYDLPTGVTAAGMVAYKSGSNGLVIALRDEANTVVWNGARDAAAAHTPTITGYESAWKLPSEAEWKQMFAAFGGSDSSYSGLNTAITNAGGKVLNTNYWLTTSYDLVGLKEEGNVIWKHCEETHLFFVVRACLAF